MQPEIPDENLVELCLQKAIQNSYIGERVLFAERAHERSIVFHIARHLAAYVNERLPGWSVDVEYDRWHPGVIDGVKKRLVLAGESDIVDVYPDIIVHRRLGSSGYDNLLVVEVKKEGSAASRIARDHLKLNAFMDEPFAYRHAVLIALPANGGSPQWQWATQGSWRKSTPVFD